MSLNRNTKLKNGFLVVKPGVPLTNKPLNPKAQGGEDLTTSGFPAFPRHAQQPSKSSPVTALSARGQIVWRILQA